MRDDPIVKANEAEMILNHPVFKKACEQIESEIMRLIQQSEFNGSKNAERYREKLNLLLYCQGRYKSLLNQTIQAGKVAVDSLERKKTFSKGL